jgi:PIN domain nuclease of toxin-antitoxin system
VASTERRLLLDTQVFLWSALEPEQLSRTAVRLLRSSSTAVYLSVASLWEISIKHQKGKLGKATSFVVDGQMEALSIMPLSITREHVRGLASLPAVAGHKDPFDRLIAAQAVTENLPLVTADPAFRKYAHVKVEW